MTDVKALHFKKKHKNGVRTYYSSEFPLERISNFSGRCEGDTNVIVFICEDVDSLISDQEAVSHASKMVEAGKMDPASVLVVVVISDKPFKQVASHQFFDDRYLTGDFAHSKLFLTSEAEEVMDEDADVEKVSLWSKVKDFFD